MWIVYKNNPGKSAVHVLQTALNLYVRFKRKTSFLIRKWYIFFWQMTGQPFFLVAGSFEKVGLEWKKVW